MQNTGLPSVLYTTPSDKVAFINANFEQQPDQRDVSTNVSHSNVMDSEVVDVKEEEDDVLCSFISSQLHSAAHDIFRVADIQQIDDAERVCNSSTGNQVLRNSSSQETHTAEKSYECDVCHKTFKYLTKHKRRIHDGVKPYVCDVCDMAFSRAYYVYSSFHEPHSAEKSYECDVCHKTFTGKYPSHFNEHKRIHTGVKPYVCDVCNMAFRTASSLNSHTYVHSDIKPFTCHICNKAFKTLRYLTEHKRIHEPHRAVKSYECDVCHKTFKHLTRHKRRIHSGVNTVKPYVCDVCDMAFSTAFKLNRHRYVHSSFPEPHSAEKSYECDVCHKMFKYHSYLVTHKQLHTRAKPYCTRQRML